MSRGAALLDPARFDPLQAGFFRFRRFGGKYLITNDFGRWRFLSDEEFRNFIAGTLDQTSALYGGLAEDGFIRNRMDFDALAGVWRSRERALWRGPSFHAVAATAPGRSMSPATAGKVVDRIFESPSPALVIAISGGEPLANWPAVRRIVESAQKRERETGKALRLRLISDLSRMDDEKLEFLLKNRVAVVSFLDGPAGLHDKNRRFLGGAGHKETVRWLKKLPRVEARPTVTRFSLPHHRDIVDEHFGLADAVFLESLSPIGLAPGVWDEIGYSAEEFLAFYRKAFDRILELNRKKVFAERTALAFLRKILTDSVSDFPDEGFPGDAGVGQLAYDVDGAIYACDEGLRLSRAGDDSFRIGSAAKGSYRDGVSHPVVKALSVASCLDNQPDCSRCVYKPYHDVSPVQCYAEQGDIMGRMPGNSRCRVHKGILDLLFEKLQDGTSEAIFRGWLAQ
jgi:sulfatase maturation enzyme AslB (radical SAM superfamily)